MPKFRFPLQKVLDHRASLKNLAQKDFEEAQAQLNLEISKLEAMQQKVKDAREDAFSRQRNGGRTSGHLTQVHEFLKGQDVRIERQTERIRECEQLVENLREILRQRAIDSKMIEEFKEKKKDEFKIEQGKRDQKLTDELNVMRYHMKGKR